MKDTRLSKLAGLTILVAAFALRGGFFILQGQLVAVCAALLGAALAFRAGSRGGRSSAPARGGPGGVAATGVGPALGARVLTPLVFALPYWIALVWAGDKSQAVLSAPVISAVSLMPVIVVNASGGSLRTIFERLVVALSAAAVVLGSLAGAMGLALPGVLEWDRLAAVLEYPNALAALLVAAAVLNWGIAGEGSGRESARESLIWWATVGILGAGLTATYSRLGWLVAAGAAALELARSLSRRSVPFALLSWAGGLVAGLGLYSSFKAHSVLRACVFLAIACGIGPVVRAIRGRFSRRAALVTVGLLLAGALVLVLVMRGDAGLKLIAARFSSSRDIELRGVFISDGFAMFLDRPLFGWGGGFFKYGSLKYRSVPYFSHFVHCAPVEALVEGGLLSGGALLAAGLTFATGVARSWKGRSGTEDRWTVSLAGLALFVHSLGDFDLSIPAMMMLFWFLYAFVPPLYLPSRIMRAGRSVAFRAAVVILLALSVTVAASSGIGFGIARRAAEAATAEGAVGRAIEIFQVSSSFAPFASDYKTDRAQLLMAMASARKDERFALEALKFDKEAVELTPLDPRLRTIYAVHLGSMARAEDAVAQAEMLVANDRFGSGGYEILATFCADAATFFMQYKEPEQARAYAEKAYAVPARITEVQQAERTAQLKYQLQEGQILPAETDGVRLAAARGAIYTGRFGEALRLLGDVGAVGLKDEVTVWRAVAHFFAQDPSYEADIKGMTRELGARAQQLVAFGKP